MRSRWLSFDGFRAGRPILSEGVLKTTPKQRI